MAEMDIFNNDAFSAMSMTASVNNMDFVPGRVGEVCNFREYGISTTTVGIEEKDSVLTLIANSPRGSVPEQGSRSKRRMRNLSLTHLTREAIIYADEIQNIRAFGGQGVLQSVQQVVNDEVELHLLSMDMTVENLRLGAYKGDILDADGSSVIYNLFDEFGVTQEAEVNFELTTATTKVRTKCNQVRRTMTKNLKLPINSKFKIHALCGADFFDSLVDHEEVKAAYDRWKDGASHREGKAYSVFEYGDIYWEDYRGSDDGTVGVESTKAHFAPVGVPGLWENPFAPADTMDFVNTPGLPRYVIPGFDPSGKNKFVSFEIQSNPLPICKRPKALMKGKRA